MFRMNRNNIEMIQGDSAEFEISVADYEVGENDKIVFTVKDLLSKEIDAKEGIVILQPEDTREAQPGVYRYDVEFRRADGEIYTIIDPHLFVLTGDITVPQEEEPVVEPEPEEEIDDGGQL